MIHTDHLGGSNIITDGEGNIVQQVQYTPYGKISYELNLGVSINYLYTGQQLDRETGLYYYNARYYDPDIGRFIQPDTIIPNPGDSQAYNRYAYCRNNPIMLTDPSGHSWLSDAWDDVCDAVEDVADWVDDNIIQEGKDFVQNNRFVKDAVVFSAGFGIATGIGLALASSFNEARPYVGTVVGSAATVVVTTLTGGNAVAGGAAGGAVGGAISAYLAGGSIRDIAKAATIGAAIGAAVGYAGNFGTAAAVAAGQTTTSAAVMGTSVIVTTKLSLTGSVIAGTINGSLSGGITAFASGDSVAKGMLIGAGTGCVTSCVMHAMLGGQTVNEKELKGLGPAFNSEDIEVGHFDAVILENTPYNREALKQGSKSFVDSKKNYSILVHGNEKFMSGELGEPLIAADIMSRYGSDPNFINSDHVILYSCSTGSSMDSVAYDLAKLSGKTVYAPNGTLYSSGQVRLQVPTVSGPLNTSAQSHSYTNIKRSPEGCFERFFPF